MVTVAWIVRWVTPAGANVIVIETSTRPARSTARIVDRPRSRRRRSAGKVGVDRRHELLAVTVEPKQLGAVLGQERAVIGLRRRIEATAARELTLHRAVGSGQPHVPALDEGDARSARRRDRYRQRRQRGDRCQDRQD